MVNGLILVPFKLALVKCLLEGLCVSCKGNQHKPIYSSLDMGLLLYSAAKNVFVKKQLQNNPKEVSMTCHCFSRGIEPSCISVV